MVRSRAKEADRPVLVLFRTDRRIADNGALSAAAETGRPVVAVFILDEQSPGVRPKGAAYRWWMHHSLEALAVGLHGLGVELVYRSGGMADVTVSLAEETGAAEVLWNRRYDPAERVADLAMAKRLDTLGVPHREFDGQLLHEPEKLRSEGYYKVYGAFWRALATIEPRDPVDAPTTLRTWPHRVRSEKLADWNMLPTKPDWAAGLRETWVPGEKAAHKNLGKFLAGPLAGYGDARDLPGIEGTSRLSPYLAHGEITPFQIHAALRALGARPETDSEKFRKEVGWREFNYHQLFNSENLAEINIERSFDAFPWRSDAHRFAAWRRGRTGYPIVDAGMRQLWRTGWMHNRVRLAASSFLVKHLLIDWREGERWFWETLVDADVASNPGNWQWIAGSGADAPPYFRIFNPVLQGRKFDTDGGYVHRFVPELAALPAKYVHDPWAAPKEALAAASVKLGSGYPVAIVDHHEARERALQAYQSIRGR